MRFDRDKLIRARELLGYGLEKTAEEAGVSKNSVLRAEHGEDIRPLTSRKIAAALGVEVVDLIEEPWSPRLKRWLQANNALRILMTDEEVLENFERLAAGSDRQAIPNRFEQETRRTFEEEASVEAALRKEWTHGGSLLPEPEDGPGLIQRAFSRHKEYSRLNREVLRSYGRYYRALEAVSKALYHDGRANDFVILNKRPQTVEAVREAERALQEEAHHNARGA